MRVSDFDYDLPERFIAQHPVAPRDRARLLVVGRDDCRDLGVTGLPDLLNPGDVLVVNDTRVIPVRLSGRKMKGTENGPKIEATLLKPVSPDTWTALARPARKLKPGDRVSFGPGLTAEVAARGEDGAVTFRFPLSDADLMAALEVHGAMPLPPYIKRDKSGGAGDPRDHDDYQTLFAEKPGAVAAPTAGLHFTPELLKAVEGAGVTVVQLTLHVGAGTFLPVKADDTRDHMMHAEWGEIGIEIGYPHGILPGAVKMARSNVAVKHGGGHPTKRWGKEQTGVRRAGEGIGKNREKKGGWKIETAHSEKAGFVFSVYRRRTAWGGVGVNPRRGRGL